MPCVAPLQRAARQPSRPDPVDPLGPRRELALVWDFKGSKDRKLKAEQQKLARLEEQLAKLDASVASKPTLARPGGS